MIHCEAFALLVDAYVAEQLPPAERRRVEGHLAGCAGCRDLADQLGRLDAALGHHHRPAPALSADFVARLQRRVAAVPALSEAHRQQRQWQLQEEYAAGLRRIRGRFPTLAGLLRGLAIGVVPAAAGAAVARGLIWALPLLGSAVPESRWPVESLAPLLLLGLGSLAAAALFASLPRWWRQ